MGYDPHNGAESAGGDRSDVRYYIEYSRDEGQHDGQLEIDSPYEMESERIEDRNEDGLYADARKIPHQQIIRTPQGPAGMLFVFVRYEHQHHVGKRIAVFQEKEGYENDGEGIDQKMHQKRGDGIDRIRKQIDIDYLLYLVHNHAFYGDSGVHGGEHVMKHDVVFVKRGGQLLGDFLEIDGGHLTENPADQGCEESDEQR